MCTIRLLIASVAAAAAFWSTAVAGADFKSVGSEPAVFYDAPTLRGTRVWVAPRGMPVDVVVAQGDWARIRDSGGGFAWVERKALVDKRMVVVVGSGAPAEIRSSADDAAPSVFRAQAGVLLELVASAAPGWVSVRHRDGQSGFVRVGNVWGE